MLKEKIAIAEQNNSNYLE
jgi:wyosine [tRNA(Phe)-imidazoG37] synthetase (radical SAM superfamily)